MQISTRLRYGLRALVDIGIYSTKKPILLREIAERQEISRSYLEQIIISLQSGGFIRSLRGRKGGFVLNKDPSEIKISEVFNTFERTFTLVECVNNPSVCHRVAQCVTYDLWRILTDIIREKLESITLQDLINWQKQKLNKHKLKERN